MDFAASRFSLFLQRKSITGCFNREVASLPFPTSLSLSLVNARHYSSIVSRSPDSVPRGGQHLVLFATIAGRSRRINERIKTSAYHRSVCVSVFTHNSQNRLAVDIPGVKPKEIKKNKKIPRNLHKMGRTSKPWATKNTGNSVMAVLPPRLATQREIVEKHDDGGGGGAPTKTTSSCSSSKNPRATAAESETSGTSGRRHRRSATKSPTSSDGRYTHTTHTK